MMCINGGAVMATTVSDATMRVVIREEINLAGTDMGREYVRTIPGINEFQRLIKRCSSDKTTTLLTFKQNLDDPLSAGEWFDQNVKYIRITNLDSSAEVSLKITSAADDVFFRLLAGESFMMTGGEDPTSFTVPAGGGDPVVYDPLTFIKCSTANAVAAVDVEVVVASA
jgi:hypothetical protein